LDHLLVLLGIFRLLKDFLEFEDRLQQVVFFPELEALLEKAIRGEEDKHAARGDLGHLGDRLAQVNDHRQALSVLVAEVEALTIAALFENADEDLFRADNMGVLEVLLEVNLQLSLERLQGRQGARGQDDRPRGQLLDLIEADTCVEAQELEGAVLHRVALVVGGLRHRPAMRVSTVVVIVVVVGRVVGVAVSAVVVPVTMPMPVVVTLVRQLLLLQQVQFAVFLGISFLDEHVVIVNVFEAPLEGDDFLDKLEPVVQ